MNAVEFTQYVHEYNDRLINIAKDNGFTFITATSVITEDTIRIDWWYSNMSYDEQSHALIAINSYFYNNRT